MRPGIACFFGISLLVLFAQGEELSYSKTVWKDWKADASISDIRLNPARNAVAVVTPLSARVVDLETHNETGKIHLTPASFNPKALFSQKGNLEVLGRANDSSSIYLFGESHEPFRLTNGLFQHRCIADGVVVEGGTRVLLATETGIFEIFKGPPRILKNGVYFSVTCLNNELTAYAVEEKDAGEFDIVELPGFDLSSARTVSAAKLPMAIIAANWPATNSLAYLTESALVAVDFITKREVKVRLSRSMMYGQAVSFRQKDQVYLAIIVAFQPGKSGSELFVVSPAMQILMRQKISRGMGICSLPDDTSGESRLLVGEAGSVNEYRIKISASK